MSKLFYFLYLFFFLFLFCLNTKDASALESCFIATDPPQIYSSTRKASFVIGVANLGGSSAFEGWKMEFKCGTPNKKEGANIEGESNISYTLDQTNYIGLGSEPCEFSSGIHEILIKAVVGGKEVDQCIAKYSVKDSISLCKLKLEPETGLTSKTEIFVSGEEIHTDKIYGLLFDKQLLNGDVQKPTFSRIQIPQQLLTPGPHSVFLSKHQYDSGVPVPIFGFIFSGVKFNGQYCPLTFRIGTEANPGSVTGSGPAGITKWVPGTASTAPPCDDDKNNPGINTAIGCIHTSPIGFIKDFLNFLISIAGGLAFLMMLAGAYQMLTSAGNPETLSAGRDRFQSAIIGLLFIIFSILLLRIIGVDILGLGTFFGVPG